MTLSSAAGSPRATELKIAHQQAGATSDFVHYVMHFAAVREGRLCEMCRRSEALRHTHYFEPPHGGA